jgi:hypothetical protein
MAHPLLLERDEEEAILATFIATTPPSWNGNRRSQLVAKSNYLL